jgi:SAM-dependent methyltransferase
MSGPGGTPTNDPPQTDTAEPVTAEVTPLLKRYPAGVIDEVSPNDHMYKSARGTDLDKAYVGHGRAALDSIRLAMLAAQKETVTSILDLPSGHGRVLRVLKAEYPEARLTACDIYRDGVDFCSSAFGATGVYGHERPADIKLGDQFDLIWCGSLLTHLDAPLWEQFLDLFQSALMPGGLLIFTTMGRSIAADMRDPVKGRIRLAKKDEQREAIVQGYDRTGFGYAEYQFPEDRRKSLSLPPKYGIALARPSWTCSLIERRPHLQLVSYMENRWGAQDVIACVRVERVDTEANPLRIPLGAGLS